jgi:predicted ester cyclase
MSGENKDLARRLMAWKFSPIALDRADGTAVELFAPEFTAHYPGFPPIDLEGARQFLALFNAAFLDIRHTIEDLIAEEDKVAVRLVVRGTHTGDLFGVPATGREVTVEQQAIVRVAGGKVAELWYSPEQMSMMQQLGAFPAPAATTSG